MRYFEGFGTCLWVKRFHCPDCLAVHTCRPLGFLRGFRYTAAVIRSSLLSEIGGGGWLKGCALQNQQYWYRCLRFFVAGRCNVNRPAVDSIASFFSERIFPVTDHFAPLRI